MKRLRVDRERRETEEEERTKAAGDGGDVAGSQLSFLPPEMLALYPGGRVPEATGGDSQATKPAPVPGTRDSRSRLGFQAPCAPGESGWSSFAEGCKEQAESTKVHRKQRAPGARRLEAIAEYTPEDESTLDDGGGSIARRGTRAVRFDDGEIAGCVESA